MTTKVRSSEAHKGLKGDGPQSGTFDYIPPVRASGTVGRGGLGRTRSVEVNSRTLNSLLGSLAQIKAEDSLASSSNVEFQKVELINLSGPQSPTKASRGPRNGKLLTVDTSRNRNVFPQSQSICSANSANSANSSHSGSPSNSATTLVKSPCGHSSSSGAHRPAGTLRRTQSLADHVPPGSTNVLKKTHTDVREMYMLGKELGRGQSGVVRLVQDKKTGEKFACKSISKQQLHAPSQVQEVQNEVAAMEALAGHPSIVALKGIFEDKENVHIIMELCEGGDLYERIKATGRYSESKAARACRSIVKALKYCRSKGILHRDLKPENIFLRSKDSDTDLRVSDFGIAVFVKPGQMLSMPAGTTFYVAPEVLDKCYHLQADIWSAGVILYIMLGGFPPFWAPDDKGVYAAIRSGKVNLTEGPWRKVSDEAKDLIKGMLTVDPAARMSTTEILAHPWIQKHHNAFQRRGEASAASAQEDDGKPGSSSNSGAKQERNSGPQEDGKDQQPPLQQQQQDGRPRTLRHQRNPSSGDAEDQGGGKPSSQRHQRHLSSGDVDDQGGRPVSQRHQRHQSSEEVGEQGRSRAAAQRHQRHLSSEDVDERGGRITPPRYLSHSHLSSEDADAADRCSPPPRHQRHLSHEDLDDRGGRSISQRYIFPDDADQMGRPPTYRHLPLEDSDMEGGRPPAASLRHQRQLSHEDVDDRGGIFVAQRHQRHQSSEDLDHRMAGGGGRPVSQRHQRHLSSEDLDQRHGSQAYDDMDIGERPSPPRHHRHLSSEDSDFDFESGRPTAHRHQRNLSSGDASENGAVGEPIAQRLWRHISCNDADEQGGGAPKPAASLRHHRQASWEDAGDDFQGARPGGASGGAPRHHRQFSWEDGEELAATGGSKPSAGRHQRQFSGDDRDEALGGKPAAFPRHHRQASWEDAEDQGGGGGKPASQRHRRQLSGNEVDEPQGGDGAAELGSGRLLPTVGAFPPARASRSLLRNGRGSSSCSSVHVPPPAGTMRPGLPVSLSASRAAALVDDTDCSSSGVSSRHTSARSSPEREGSLRGARWSMDGDSGALERPAADARPIQRSSNTLRDEYTHERARAARRERDRDGGYPREGERDSERADRDGPDVRLPLQRLSSTSKDEYSLERARLARRESERGSEREREGERERERDRGRERDSEGDTGLRARDKERYARDAETRERDGKGSGPLDPAGYNPPRQTRERREKERERDSAEQEGKERDRERDAGRASGRTGARASGASRDLKSSSLGPAATSEKEKDASASGSKYTTVRGRPKALEGTDVKARDKIDGLDRSNKEGPPSPTAASASAAAAAAEGGDGGAAADKAVPLASQLSGGSKEAAAAKEKAPAAVSRWSKIFGRTKSVDAGDVKEK
eukprot:jgi/Mesen1/6342/ME000328S05627